MKTRYILGLLASAFMMNAQAQELPFPAIQENLYDASEYAEDLDEVMIPASPFKYDVLFVGGVDMVHNKNGASALAKEWQDFTAFIPIDGRSDSGYVVVNHERMQTDATNGDGGGMTVFTAYHNPDTDTWEAVQPDGGYKFRNVDFSNVGGTGANCGGIQTPWGQVWTAEEWGSAFGYAVITLDEGTANERDSILSPNQNIYTQGFSDTTDFLIEKFNGTTVNESVSRANNFQYMVEIDVEKAEAIRKNYNMGRYDHEGGWIASDRKTVYLSDDNSSGSVLFRFVADVAEDFSKGQLSAYKQSEDGESGTWVDLPMTLDAAMNAQEEALKLDATIFMRLEWVEGINDETVFITETGRGKKQSIASKMRIGGQPAKHLKDMDSWSEVDSSFNDVFGRVLRLNTTTGKIESAIEGGGPTNGDVATGNHLSSPDGLASISFDGRTFLAINEDMNIGKGTAPANPAQFSSVLNEVYIVEVTNDAPGKTYSVDTDLGRFLVGPKDCETTGGRFTPDGSTYFVNIQHPAADNEYPFNHSTTLAVTGFKDYLKTTSIDAFDTNESGFQVYPNPVSRELHLNETTDVAIYDVSGVRVKVQRNTNRVDVSGLVSGIYFIQNTEGEMKKLVVE